MQSFAEPMSDCREWIKLIQRQGELTELLDHHNAWDLDSRLQRAMDALAAVRKENRPVNVLSGGERRRVALCRLLLKEPDILLLDEPTNHLDAESVQWLEQHLQQYKGTVIAITHDRYFWIMLPAGILELDRGEGIHGRGIIPPGWNRSPDRLAMEEKLKARGGRHWKESLNG